MQRLSGGGTITRLSSRNMWSATDSMRSWMNIKCTGLLTTMLLRNSFHRLWLTNRYFFLAQLLSQGLVQGCCSLLVLNLPNFCRLLLRKWMAFMWGNCNFTSSLLFNGLMLVVVGLLLILILLFLQYWLYNCTCSCCLSVMLQSHFFVQYLLLCSVCLFWLFAWRFLGLLSLCFITDMVDMFYFSMCSLSM